MKNLAEFEAAVSEYVAEQKRFFSFFKIWMVVALPWMIGLLIFHAASLPTPKFVLFVVVVPLAFFAAIMFRAFKLDATAERVGLRCPKCRRWLNRPISVEVIRKTGLCSTVGQSSSAGMRLV
jgi:type II secretory pathway component PulF